MQETRIRDADCERYGCDYHLPHYHCKICARRILIGDGDRRETYNPCCSLGHIRIYNVIFFCSECGHKLNQQGAECLNCNNSNNSNNSKETHKTIPKPLTDLSEYRKDHPIRIHRPNHSKGKFCSVKKTPR